MPVLRIHFVGGPFDGAFMDADVDADLPTCLFLREGPPGQVSRFGLISTPWPVEGAERYILSAREAAEATYLHESIHAGRPQRRREAMA